MLSGIAHVFTKFSIGASPSNASSSRETARKEAKEEGSSSSDDGLQDVVDEVEVYPSASESPKNISKSPSANTASSSSTNDYRPTPHEVHSLAMSLDRTSVSTVGDILVPGFEREHHAFQDQNVIYS